MILNDLYDYDGMKIYQNKDNFKFSLDSILLAEFVELKKSTNLIVDFCTGNAPVPLILATKSDCCFKGFEIQKKISELAEKSVSINNLDSRIEIINDNFRNAKEYIKAESVDAVTCNPPYFKYVNSSIINEDSNLAIARHEIEMNLEDVMSCARYILKNKAPLYLVHRCDRLEEIIVLLNKYDFSVKKIQFIYSDLSKEAIMVLIKGVKNGNVGSLKIMPPIDITKYSSYKGIFEMSD